MRYIGYIYSPRACTRASRAPQAQKEESSILHAAPQRKSSRAARTPLEPLQRLWARPEEWHLTSA